MPLIPATAEELALTQQELRGELRPPVSEARNVAVAAETNADTMLVFRRVTYVVPPLPYNLGVQLQEIEVEIRRLAEWAEQMPMDKWTPVDREQYMLHLVVCYERAIDLFWKVAYPLMPWRRLFYRKTLFRRPAKNPFLQCSHKEIGELLGFFFECRMKSRVSLVGSSVLRPSVSTLLTQPTNSPASPGLSLVG